MKKPRFTEEFLWKIYGINEAFMKVDQVFPHTLYDVLKSEGRKLRLAYQQKQRKRTFNQFISYLKSRGYIKIPEGEAISFPQLTIRGKQKALAGRIKVTEWPVRKDGKMIMVMYDIPKQRAQVRHAFRDRLEFLDYQMFQESVWVSDKDVVEETEHAMREYRLENCVDLFIIKKVQVQK